VAVRVVATTDGALVVIKPAGLASELPRDRSADSLLRRLAVDGNADLRLVHRLDTPACGLMLVARSRAAAAYYSAEIEARRWQKWYVARVGVEQGSAARLVGSHKAYLKTTGAIARVVRAGGRPSFLDVVATAAAPGWPGQSHVLVQLHTGRFHQIRALLADAGAPLAGDRAYGGAPHTPFYLEHVVLGVRADGTHAWTVWEAPTHVHRDRWADSLASAVAAAAVTARRTPPPPAPAP